MCCRAGDDWRCITLDNHESHISLEFIEFAYTHKIIVVSLAPKTSGKFQPLDVSCFHEYQKAYGKAVEDEVRAGICITKQDFGRFVSFSAQQLS
jgi:hypothetical protein